MSIEFGSPEAQLVLLQDKWCEEIEEKFKIKLEDGTTLGMRIAQLDAEISIAKRNAEKYPIRASHFEEEAKRKKEELLGLKLKYGIRPIPKLEDVDA